LTERGRSCGPVRFPVPSPLFTGCETAPGNGYGAARRVEASVTYILFKNLHLLGAIILIGNVTVTAVWKVFADRTREPAIIAFAQRLVTYTDWAFTLSGVVLIMVGGYGMTWIAGMNILSLGWLVWGQIWFYGSGLIWLFILIPTQIAQARQTRAFTTSDPIPEPYRRLARHWILWGVISTLPLVMVLYLMIAKP
jgi:uncharacterized membrane protein